jgi:hypothetical protein
MTVETVMTVMTVMTQVRDTVGRFSHRGTGLTVPGTYSQPAPMPPELLLVERVHVDLARHASARCPGC